MEYVDYEKLHKDTIAKLQEMVNSGKITVETARGICADFIPESEDERIRKELIAEVKEQIDCIPAPDCRDKEDEKALKQLNKWLAWLEKQGEHANFRNKIQIGDKVTRNEDGVLVNLSQLNRVAEKQGEQKPNDWKPQTGDIFRKKGTTYPTYHLCDKREDGITFGFVENREVGISGGEITIFALRQDYELVERPKSIEDVFEEELNKALQTKGEQKTADKYKEWYDFIRWFVKQRTDDYTLIPSGDDIHKWGDNILNHARKVLEQKPAWSEEDEVGLGDAMWAIQQARTIAKDENDMGNLWCAERWLNSLKDKYTWKPSDEQIIELRRVISGCSYDIEPLAEMDEQLKKLREE